MKLIDLIIAPCLHTCVFFFYGFGGSAAQLSPVDQTTTEQPPEAPAGQSTGKNDAFDPLKHTGFDKIVHIGHNLYNRTNDLKAEENILQKHLRYISDHLDEKLAGRHNKDLDITFELLDPKIYDSRLSRFLDKLNDTIQSEVDLSIKAGGINSPPIYVLGLREYSAVEQYVMYLMLSCDEDIPSDNPKAVREMVKETVASLNPADDGDASLLEDKEHAQPSKPGEERAEEEDEAGQRAEDNDEDHDDVDEGDEMGDVDEDD